MTRAFSPSTARNREPILAVLQRVLPAGGSVLEVASGTGEHAVFVARALPRLTWQPSDPDAQSRASIAAWIAEERLQNVLPPRDIDVLASDWGVAGPFDAIVAINMVHISPWRRHWVCSPALRGWCAKVARCFSMDPTSAAGITPRHRTYRSMSG